MPLQGGVADGVHNGNFNYCSLHYHCNKKEIAANSHSRRFIQIKLILGVNRLSVHLICFYYIKLNCFVKIERGGSDIL